MAATAMALTAGFDAGSAQRRAGRQLSAEWQSGFDIRFKKTLEI